MTKKEAIGYQQAIDCFSVLARRMYAELPESSERLIDFGLRDWRKVGEV